MENENDILYFFFGFIIYIILIRYKILRFIVIELYTIRYERMNLIRLENVSVKYNKFFALKNINLEINKGDYLGIIGPNGSGKTTLLKSILGLVKISQGKISIFKSTDISDSRKRIGYVPQNPNSKRYFPATVQEIVEMGLYSNIGFLNPLTKTHRTIAGKALHKVHMGHFKNRPIGHLSGGELQKVMVARAIVSEPEILLLDEPTSSLDFVMTKELLELLKELNEKYNLTIITINHQLNLLIPYCNRILILKKNIVYDGPPESSKINGIINQIFSF